MTAKSKEEEREVEISGGTSGGALKHDPGKPQLYLLPPWYWDMKQDDGDLGEQVLWAIATEVSTWFFFRGETPDGLLSALGRLDILRPEPASAFEYFIKREAKRDPNFVAAFNWTKGFAWSRLVSSTLRHIVAVADHGESIDPESGLPHVDHILSNLVMLISHVWYGLGTDDRPKIPGLGE